MKRIVIKAVGLLLIAGFAGMMGCEGGGVEPGMPADVSKPDVPQDKMKEMANMASGKTPPPSTTGKPLPKTGPTDPAPAGTTPEKKN